MTDLPPPKQSRPQFKAAKFTCPHCGMFSPQTWLPLLHRSDHPNYATDLLETGPALAVLAPFAGKWHAARCGSCERPSLWRIGTMVYPLHVGGAPHDDMPVAVRALFEEATAVAAVSRRAGAAMARATVERLIKSLDPDAPNGASLALRIQRIKLRVSVSLGQMLDIVRVTGNGAVHVDDQPGELVVLALDDEQGPELLELLLETANDLVDELIARPKAVAGLWDKLPAGVQTQLRPEAVSDGTGGSASAG